MILIRRMFIAGLAGVAMVLGGMSLLGADAAADRSVETAKIAERHLAEAKGKCAIELLRVGAERPLYRTDNAAQQIPSASTIKVLIMARLFERLAAGELKPGQLVTVPKTAKIPGGIIYELDAETYTLKDLITLMIALSDNTATNILIDLAGFDQTNALARKLGLPQTRLQRKMLDFAAAKAGRQNYTSADDMTRLFDLIAQGRVVSPEASAAMIDVLKRQQDNHSFKRYLSEDLVVAHKSGWLDGLELESGVFFLPDGEYVLTVFTWDWPDNGSARDFIGAFTRDWYRSCGGR